MLRNYGTLARRVRQGFIAVLIAAQCGGGSVLPVAGVMYHADSRAAACGQQAAGSAIPFAPAGSEVQIPLLVAEVLGVPPVQRVESLPPAVAQRIRQLVAAILPCWPRAVNEVAVLRQPQIVPQQVPAQPMAGAKTGVMTGITALQKRNASNSYSATNIAIRIYLFLPPEVLDGWGLETRVRCANIIPYAAAPVPETYGDLLDWTVVHELWHVVDIQARLKHILGGTQTAGGGLDQVLQEPAQWAAEFQEVRIASLLGWHDLGERYEQSDELARPLRVTRGATTYTHVMGGFVVAYADGEYAFKRQLVRAGYMPEVFEKLDDLQSLLKSGKYPTLYGLFNTDEERFAEYGAWYLFARLHAAEGQYAQMSQQLANYYKQRWEAARGELCSPTLSSAAAAARSGEANPSVNHR